MVASLVWLSFFVYFASLRGDDSLGFGIMLVIGWLIASVGLAGFWIVVAVVAFRAWLARNSARMWRAAAFLAPFPMAVAAAIFLSANDLPLRVRFNLSEGSLNGLADRYEQGGNGSISGRAGLYYVKRVREWENCTVLVTGNFIFDEYGFARCSGHPPEGDNPWNITLKHLEGDWWLYDDLD